MTDRNVQYPTRYRMTKVAGTDDIYEMEPVPGEVTDEGTIINKEALLKDATAALFGFTAEQIPDTVPDDVLVVLKTLVDDAQNLANAKAKIQFGSYIGTGTYGANAPNSLTFFDVPKIVRMYGSGNSVVYTFSDSNSGRRSETEMVPDFLTTDFESYRGFCYNMSTSSHFWGKASADKKTIYWYCDNSAAAQFNAADAKYYYFAIFPGR